MHPGHWHWWHDLRLLCGTCGKSLVAGAGRANRQCQPGHRIGAHRRGSGYGTGRPYGGFVAPRRARCRLRAQRRRCRARCARTLALGGLCAGGLGLCSFYPAGLTHAWRFVGPALDAARRLAMCPGHAGATGAGCPLLPRRLACAARVQWQYGLAGCLGHYRRLGAVGVAVAKRAARRHGAFVFRRLGAGDYLGPDGQMAGGPRQAPNHLGHPRAARFAPGACPLDRP